MTWHVCNLHEYRIAIQKAVLPYICGRFGHSQLYSCEGSVLTSTPINTVAVLWVTMTAA